MKTMYSSPWHYVPGELKSLTNVDTVANADDTDLYNPWIGSFLFPYIACPSYDCEARGCEILRDLEIPVAVYEVQNLQFTSCFKIATVSLFFRVF